MGKSKTLTQSDSSELPHSPLRLHSPLRSDQLEPSPKKSHSKSIVTVKSNHKQYSLHRSPLSEHQKAPPENTIFPKEKIRSPVNTNFPAEKVREQQSPEVTKIDLGRDGGGGVEEGRRERRAEMRRSQTEETVSKAALGFRVCEVVLCLISFSVMASDKTPGWSGDSFDRYKEYRYCLSVTVIAFVYSGFQAYDLTYYLIMEKHVIQHHLRCHFDFVMDQILAYLIISASSSAAARVDIWQSNWGNDEFTERVSASIGMAFLAFVAFVLSSLISGYNLCTRDVR